MRKPILHLSRKSDPDLPDWMVAYLEHGTIPADCSPDAHEFNLWFLISGTYFTEGRNWPNPDTVPHPDRFPESDAQCDDYVPRVN